MKLVSDISAIEAYKRLKNAEDAALVDVRTKKEFVSIGVPDLSHAKAKLLLLPMYEGPHIELNPAFEKELDKFIQTHHIKELYFICRSGGRSQVAAELYCVKGYKTFNITDGFEGKTNENGQRGLINGWKAGELPWRFSNVFETIQ